jgi:hypothetical protein
MSLLPMMSAAVAEAGRGILRHDDGVFNHGRDESRGGASRAPRIV